MGETFIPRIRIGIAKIVVAILVFAGSVLLARQRDADRPQSAPAIRHRPIDVDSRHIRLSIINAMSTSEFYRRNIGLTKL